MNKSILLSILLSLLLCFTLLTFLSEPGKKPLKTSGAMQSLEHWAIQRTYPNKTIPDRSYTDAYEYYEANMLTSEDRSSQWKSIGPLNIGGRTLSIAFNPLNGNTVFAGSASGGIWRSYSGGTGVSAWDNVATGFPVLGVSSIAVSNLDTNTIYIGTGEVYAYLNANGGMVNRLTRGSYGIGILKTTNYGATWSKSLDWTYDQNTGVQVVKINPLNSNTVWAGTTVGTFVTHNAGLNWTQINNTLMVTDLVINPVDTGTVFIACGNLSSENLGIYRTTNSGSNWIKLTNGLPSQYGGKVLLSMYETSPNVIFASIGFGFQNASPTQLLKTVDNGNTWVTVSDVNYATYQGWYSHFVGVNPVDSSQVIVGGIDIHKSTEGGVNLFPKSFWSIGYPGRTPIGGPEGPPNYSHADHHAIAYHPQNPEIIYFANDGGVFRTTDGGETFDACNGGYQTTQFYPGFSSAATDSLFAIGGMQDNGSAIYDGDSAWIRVIGGDGCWTGINRRNKDTLYGSYQFLNMLVSTDAGQNYSPISPQGGFGTAFVAPFILAYNNPQILYAGRTVVFKSTDAGFNWEIMNGGSPLDGNVIFTMAVSKKNDNIVYAATAPQFSRAKVFRTSNGGDSWSEITGSLPDRYISDLAVDPLNSDRVYCTISGFGSPHVYKSENGGGTWNNITNELPDVPTSSITIDPVMTDYIYIGNDIGVFVSTNSGQNWSAFQTGITDASMVIELSISETNRVIRAVTHGKGIFQRDLYQKSVGITNNNSEVTSYGLSQNYPNPFNPYTSITYQLPKNDFVSLKVYDVNGRIVATLVDEFKNAGSHTVRFDAANLSSGIYFCRLEVMDNGSAGKPGFVSSKSMLLIK